MLQSIRDGLQSHKWLMYIVLGSLALIFAAWGAYGIVSFNAGGSTYAAEAGGQKVSIETARSAWLNQQAQYQQRLGGEIPPAQKAFLQDRLLESMIRDALLTQRSHDLGYRVSEADVRDAVRNEPAFQIEGKYSPEVARERLAQAGITLNAFEIELRGALQRAQLQNGIIVSDFQTATEIQRARALENEQREVRYALLSPDKYSADIQVDDAAVDAYYKSHQAQYMTPESASLQYAELRLDQLAAQVSLSDADLQAAYDKNKDRYNEPEKRHGRHILIPIGKDDAAARKQADEVLAQAKAGKDFAALAKQYSQDPGSADKGGDLGWADRKQFVGPFADALFGMAVAELRGPVKTQFGYHIIRLDEIQPGKTKSFESVRPELEAQLKRNAAADKFGEIQEQIQSRLEQAGNDLNVLAKEFNLATGEVPKFLRGAGGAPLGTAQPLQDIVFGDSPLQPGRIGGPVLVGEDRLVLDQGDRTQQAGATSRWRKCARASWPRSRRTVARRRLSRRPRTLKRNCKPARRSKTWPSSSACHRKPLASFHAPMPLSRPSCASLYSTHPSPTTNRYTRPSRCRPAELPWSLSTQLRVDAPETDKPADLPQRVMQAKQDAARHGQADVGAYIEEMRRTAEVRKNPKAFE